MLVTVLQKQGNALNLTLGYSHPIVFEAVSGVDLNVDKQTTIIVTGASKEDVGETAAKDSFFKSSEPYHGKGVRYENEHIATKSVKQQVKNNR